MQQATPTPARVAVGGMTPSRMTGGSVVGGGGEGGGGGSGGGGVPSGADSRPLELMKAIALAVTAEEKNLLENHNSGSADVAGGGGGGGQYPCPMTMATPTPVHRGGGGGDGGGVRGGGAAAGKGAVAMTVTVGELGFFGRVEDGLTAFLVLALGVLRYKLILFTLLFSFFEGVTAYGSGAAGPMFVGLRFSPMCGWLHLLLWSRF